MPAVPHALIGRDSEQAALGTFLEQAHDGRRVLLLEGEAGIGKTSLWNAALSTAVMQSYRILSSAPTEAEYALPYAVLGDLLDPLPEEAMGCLSISLRTALEVALFRAPADQVPTDQLAVSTAFLRLIRHLATDRRVLLALDDIQWADGPSMRVLTFAIHRIEGEQIKLLTTLRLPTRSDAGAALRRAVGDDQVQKLAVRPLPLDVLDDLLLQRLERPLRRSELEHVYAVSGGNPFFALEIGRFIIQHPADLKAGEPLPVPASLSDAIRSRVQRLSPATLDLLVAMAALSRPDEKLLHQVDSDAIAALDEASHAQVIDRAEGHIRFSHPLLASVIYSMAGPAARRRWHSRLASLVADSEEKAHHLALATTSPDTEVADELESAARSANARGAPDAAASLAQQASELTPADQQDAIQRRQILTAEYRMRAGDVPGASALLEQVLRSSPAGKKPAEALRLMGSLTLGGEDFAAAELLLTEALSQTDDDESQAIICRDLVRILHQRGKFQEALIYSRRLSEIAARRGDPSLVVIAQRMHAATERFVGRISPETRALAAGLADELVSLPIDENPGGLHPLMDWAVILKWSDDFVRARALFKRILAMTEGRDESLRIPALFHLAELECWTGDWLLSALYLHECEKTVMHSGHPTYARLPLSAKALLLCCRGEFESARAAAREALLIATAIDDDMFRRRVLSHLGSTEFAAGDPVAADQWFETLRSCGNHVGFRGVVRSEGDEIETFIALGKIDGAEAVLARIADYDDPWQRTIGARGRALVAASRGDFETSISEFQRALTEHEQLHMPLERARTLLAYGTTLRRAKQKRSARARLQEARAIFQSLGAPAWTSRAESELARIAPAPAGIAELTPTEAKVAALVAKGRTNKEVAAALFLSVKTVEANLSRIYNKLNVRSRSELVVRLK